VGEKAATVGGFVELDSLLSAAEWPAFADVDEVSDMELIQGVSVVLKTCQYVLSACSPGCCPERLYHQEHVIAALPAGEPKHKKPGTSSGNHTYQRLP
jgi:hypothetical protein